MSTTTIDNENLTPYHTCNWYSETGKQLHSKDLGDLAKQLKPVYKFGWQSGWSPTDAYYQDFISIMRTPEGYWASYSYECDGYSSYTYEPIEVVNIIESTDFEKFWNLVLTDKERDKLVIFKSKIGQFLYV